MSAEANKALVRRLIEEANNGGDIALVDTLVAPDYVWHDNGPANREEYKRFIAWQRATSDWHIAIQQMVAEGDMVTVRATASGTRTEEAPCVPYPEPRFRQIAWINLYRVADGRIAEVWNGRIGHQVWPVTSR
jgi:predicted SnoaL-like aldol condensation-catalyzing enzyme